MQTYIHKVSSSSLEPLKVPFYNYLAPLVPPVSSQLDMGLN